MANEQEMRKAIAELSKKPGEKLTMAEFIAKIWGDKIVEIYIGDTYEDIKLDDSTCKVPSILVGKIIGAYAECIMLNCAFADQQTGNLAFGNIVALNERGIRTITEIDDVGNLRDTFLNIKDGKRIKQAVMQLEGTK
jgi:hypothetical protein